MLTVVAAVLLLPGPTSSSYGGGPGPDPLPCELSAFDPWVGEIGQRFIRDDPLAKAVQDQYGAPVECEGEVTSRFDGGRFGYVRFAFVEGVVLKLETAPVETTVITLEVPRGFRGEQSLTGLVAAYLDAMGWGIEWREPAISEADGIRVETYWNPEPGFNASAAFMFSDDLLVGVRTSIAL